MSAEPSPAPRIVRPRKPASAALSIVALTRRELLLERTGETFPIDQLPHVVVAERSSLFVAQTFGRHLLNLHEAFQGNDLFQFKLVPIYRDSHPINGNRTVKQIRRDTTVSCFGFPGHLHYPLDPVTFVRAGLDDLDPGPRPALIKLLEWAREVRAFCIANDLRPKPTSGGLAAQLLRDRRFYSAPRRKAPRRLNDKARPTQPGNYYRLFVPEGTMHTAAYLDMSNAHHHAARSLAFPCVNSLHGYGYWHEDGRGRSWFRSSARRFREELARPGLFHLRVSVPRVHPLRFPPPYMETPGQKRLWLYSNELDSFRRLGGSIDGIICALTSREVEIGLNRYAEWALAELERRADQREWLKPVLHSTYGILSVRPRELEVGYRVAKGGTDEEYPLGPGIVKVKAIRSGRTFEPVIANVIHRGMIEAETRERSLALARELHSRGGQVLCIYADSLFVKLDQLPLLPEPWKVKEHCRGLVFHNATSFTSPQITRLPGISRKLRNDAARRPFRRGQLIG